MIHVLQIWWLRLARNAGVLWGTAIISTVLAVLCFHFDQLDIGDAEQDAFDDGLTALTEWSDEPALSDDIVIVAIDDDTFNTVAANPFLKQEYGTWPYTRNIWADVFTHLADKGARAIVFDAFMDEPFTDPTPDEILGDAIAELDVPVFLGFNVMTTDATSIPPKVEDPVNHRPLKNKRPAKAATKGAGAPTEDPGGFGSEAADEGGFGSEAADEGGFGSEAEDQGGFGSEAEGGFGSEAADEGGFGSEAEDQGGFGSEAEDQGGFGSEAEDPGGFGSEAEDQGGFGSEAEDQGGFGSEAQAKGIGSGEGGDAGKGPEFARRVTRAAPFLAFPVRTEGGLELPPLHPEEEEGDAQTKFYPVPPIAHLIEPISGYGLLVPEADEDGNIRRTQFAYTDGVNNYVTLSVAVVADLWDADEVVIAPGRLRIGDRAIAINKDGAAEIDYGGELRQRFPIVSLNNVLYDANLKKVKPQDRGPDDTEVVPEGYFKDRIVFIGGFAAGTADEKTTPFEAGVPGVVKQATEVQNLLDRRFIVSAPFWQSVLITFLIALFSVAVVLVFQNVLLDVGYPLALFYGFFAFTGIFLVHQELHILSAMPSYAAAFAGGVAALYNHVFISQDRERLKEVFAGRVRNRDLELLVERKVIPKLEGETREVTVLVTDINDFSRLVARYEKDPEQLARIVNGYLTEVTEVLQSHGGHIVKYVGDTVECMFNAPIPDRHHAVSACRAALDVQRVADSIDLGVPEEERAVFHTRTGIVTATGFVGNYGSEQAPEYTVIGRPMRDALLISKANERMKTRILIGPKTKELAQAHIMGTPVAPLEISPGEAPVVLFELEGMKK